MISIGENKFSQFATVWRVEDKGSYATVDFSTSRKDKKSGEYVNTNWKFVRFVGNAYNEDLLALKEKTRIVIKAGGISQEPYLDKDGNKAWPKYPQVVVFAWGMPDAPANNDVDDDKPPFVEDESEDDDNPFS